MDYTVWTKKFLYPFQLDPAPLRLQDHIVEGATIGGPPNLNDSAIHARPTADNFDVLDSNRFNFPLTHIDSKDGYIQDITQPLTV